MKSESTAKHFQVSTLRRTANCSLCSQLNNKQTHRHKMFVAFVDQLINKYTYFLFYVFKHVRENTCVAISIDLSTSECLFECEINLFS